MCVCIYIYMYIYIHIHIQKGQSLEVVDPLDFVVQIWFPTESKDHLGGLNRSTGALSLAKFCLGNTTVRRARSDTYYNDGYLKKQENYGNIMIVWEITICIYGSNNVLL